MSDNVRVALRLLPSKNEGYGIINLRIGIPGKKTYKHKSLKYKIPTGLWDAESCQVKKGYPNYQYVNADINNQRLEIERSLLNDSVHGKRITALSIKRKLATPDDDFISFFEEFIKNIGAQRTKHGEATQKYAKSYIDKWSGYLNTLKRYAKGVLPFSDIDTKWLDDYEHFCGAFQNKETSLPITMKKIVQVLKKASSYRLFDMRQIADYNRPAYKQPDKPYLTLKQTETLADKIYKKELDPTPELKAVCCYFLIECYCGIRFSDWGRFTIERIMNTEAIKVRAKKNGQPVYVPLSKSPRLKKIASYVIKNQIKVDITEQHTNRLLKTVGGLVGAKFPITTHVGRHTCATLLLELGYSKETIAEQLGISVRTVDIYAKYTRQKLRNEYKEKGGL